jgi:hypothetical protein
MSKQFYAYLYSDIDGTPLYAGKGHGRRAWRHVSNKNHLSNLLRKRQRNGVCLIPKLYNVESKELALLVEEELIDLYGRRDLGTGSLLNLTDGGQGQSGLVQSEYKICRLIECRTGENNHRFGTTWSEEIREKMKNRIPSNKGKTLSEEWRAKMSVAKKGKPPHNKGVKYSSEKSALMNARKAATIAAKKLAKMTQTNLKD